MCKVGDIIVVDSYKDHGKTLKKHSFVVISDTAGEIEGFPYDLIGNVLSSFKTEDQRNRKLSYPGNYEIKNSDTVTNPDNGKDGYIKTDQLYYFNKSLITYSQIGTVNYDTMQAIFKFISEGSFPIVQVIDNVKDS